MLCRLGGLNVPNLIKDASNATPSPATLVLDRDTITLTIACAIVDKYCANIKEYVEYMDILKEHIGTVAKKSTKRKVVVHVNTADDIKNESVFLTVTGTSAEMGDDGSVGRGNRCNGLITPNRPMSMEATSGKNPITHIGKIYNLEDMQKRYDKGELDPKVN